MLTPRSMLWIAKVISTCLVSTSLHTHLGEFIKSVDKHLHQVLNKTSTAIVNRLCANGCISNRSTMMLTIVGMYMYKYSLVARPLLRSTGKGSITST